MKIYISLATLFNLILLVQKLGKQFFCYFERTNELILKSSICNYSSKSEDYKKVRFYIKN